MTMIFLSLLLLLSVETVGASEVDYKSAPGGSGLRLNDAQFAFATAEGIKKYTNSQAGSAVEHLDGVDLVSFSKELFEKFLSAPWRSKFDISESWISKGQDLLTVAANSSWIYDPALRSAMAMLPWSILLDMDWEASLGVRQTQRVENESYASDNAKVVDAIAHYLNPVQKNNLITLAMRLSDDRPFEPNRDATDDLVLLIGHNALVPSEWQFDYDYEQMGERILNASDAEEDGDSVVGLNLRRASSFQSVSSSSWSLSLSSLRSFEEDDESNVSCTSQPAPLSEGSSVSSLRRKKVRRGCCIQ